MNERNKRKARIALFVTSWIGSPSSVVLHTFLFVCSFLVSVMGFIEWDRMLLVVTTLVSLEAIYLSIFIQMSLNYTQESMDAVEEDIEEIQKDVDEIQKDVDEIQEDVDEIQKDVDEIEESEEADEAHNNAQKQALEEIKLGLGKLMSDIEKIKG